MINLLNRGLLWVVTWILKLIDFDNLIWNGKYKDYTYEATPENLYADRKDIFERLINNDFSRLNKFREKVAKGLMMQKVPIEEILWFIQSEDCKYVGDVAYIIDGTLRDENPEN